MIAPIAFALLLSAGPLRVGVVDVDRVAETSSDWQAARARSQSLGEEIAKRDGVAIVFLGFSGRISYVAPESDLTAEVLKAGDSYEITDKTKRTRAVLSIGIIDANQVLNAVREGAAAAERIKTKAAKLEKELADEERAIEAAKATLTPEALAAREARLEQTFMKYQQDLAVLKAYEIEQMLPKLEKSVAAVARRHGFALVIDRERSGIGYADAGLDITEETVKAFDSGKVEPGTVKAHGTNVRFVDNAPLIRSVSKDGEGYLRTKEDNAKFEAVIEPAIQSAAQKAGAELVLLKGLTVFASPAVETELDLTDEVLAARKK